MKPNEIKKGLEDLINHTHITDQKFVLCYVFDYINQLEAEVEKYKVFPVHTLSSSALICTKTSEEYDELIADIGNEAIKEFVERLKNEITSETAYGCDTNQHSGYYDYSIKIGDIPEYIDNLVKRKVSDNDV